MSLVLSAKQQHAFDLLTKRMRLLCRTQHLILQDRKIKAAAAAQQ